MHYDANTLLIAVQTAALIFYAGKLVHRVEGHGKAIFKHDEKLQKHDQQLTEHHTFLKLKGLPE